MIRNSDPGVPLGPPEPNAPEPSVEPAPVEPAKTTTGTRKGSKEAKVITMIERPNGATLAEIMKETGWQAHTVRGMISAALKKKRGLPVISEKNGDGERVYRIPVAA